MRMECNVSGVINQVPGTELKNLAIVLMTNVKLSPLLTMLSQGDRQRQRLGHPEKKSGKNNIPCSRRILSASYTPVLCSVLSMQTLWDLTGPCSNSHVTRKAPQTGWAKPVVLTLRWAPEPGGGWVTAQAAESLPRSLRFSRAGLGTQGSHVNRFPGDAAAADLGSTPEKPRFQ